MNCSASPPSTLLERTYSRFPGRLIGLAAKLTFANIGALSKSECWSKKSEWQNHKPFLIREDRQLAFPALAVSSNCCGVGHLCWRHLGFDRREMPWQDLSCDQRKRSTVSRCRCSIFPFSSIFIFRCPSLLSPGALRARALAKRHDPSWDTLKRPFLSGDFWTWQCGEPWWTLESLEADDQKLPDDHCLEVDSETRKICQSIDIGKWSRNADLKKGSLVTSQKQDECWW